MLTIKEILLRTTAFFQEKGIESPRLNAEVLIANGLGLKSRLEIYLQHDRPLEERELERVRPLIKRRSSGVPLQYIEGKANFFGFDFIVDEKVLIPRPETEELVEFLERFYRNNPPVRILDLGTGSGILALTLARLFEQSSVAAVDISAQALDIAKKNAVAQGLLGRLSFIESNWYTKVDGEFDLIVSNPPYLTEKEFDEASVEVRMHEPREALVSPGIYGEDCLFKVLEGAFSRLATGGIVAMETGIHQHPVLGKKAQELGFPEFWSEKDLSGRDRFFFVQK
jgi:release factor glutamine methyltransferase